MKKSVLLVIVAISIAATSFAQEKRYGFESAILKRKSVIQAAGIEQTVSSTQYIADYGVKESAETAMNVQGMEIFTFSMMKDGYAYTANLTTKQGMKVMNLATVLGDYSAIDYLNLTDEVKKQFQIEENGNEQFLGKNCKSYGLTITVQGQTMKATVLVWQGLALKLSATAQNNISITDEVTEIQEGVKVPNEKFELPEGIEFMEVNLPGV